MPTGVYPRRERSLADICERFWAKVSTGDGCWEWTAGTEGFGYGKFMLKKRVFVAAHRFAWTLAHGNIPDGLIVRHKCDNPACVRVEHLELGTHADNARDCSIRGRRRNGRNGATHCIRGHEFTTENTYLHPRRASRHCKACQVTRTKSYLRRHSGRSVA